MPRVVLDTNVVVSAHLNPAGLERAVLNWALEQGFFVEWLSQAAAAPLLAVAGRVSDFDAQVTAPLAASVGESVDLAASGVGMFRNARLGRYLAGALVVIAILTLLSVLAATGHLWVHTA